jgi:hypothetical protein
MKKQGWRTAERTTLSLTKFVFGIVCAIPLAAQPAVSGHVTLGQGYHPQGGATVLLQSLADSSILFKTSTDRQGKYAFDEVPDGKYSIEATQTDATGIRYSPIRVVFPYRIELNFALLPIPSEKEGGIQISAEVKGELKRQGQRLSHTKLCLTRDSQGKCVETNGIGQYYLAVQPGAYQATVSLAGEVLWTGAVELPRVGQYLDKIRLDQDKQR